MTKFKVIESEVKMVYEVKTWILELELFEKNLVNLPKKKVFFFIFFKELESSEDPQPPLMEVWNGVDFFRKTTKNK